MGSIGKFLCFVILILIINSSSRRTTEAKGGPVGRKKAYEGLDTYSQQSPDGGRKPGAYVPFIDEIPDSLIAISSTTPAFPENCMGKPMILSKSAMYGSCGKTKSCFGFPDGCIQKQRCWVAAALWEPMEKEISTDEYTASYVNIAVAATSSATAGYVSIGFSMDPLMGDDIVFSCLTTPNGPKMALRQSYNDENYNNIREAFQNTSQPIIGYAQSNGVIYCGFRIKTEFFSPLANRTYDLFQRKYHILLAFGKYSTKDGQFGNLLGHHAGVASEGVALMNLYMNPRILDSYPTTYISWHIITSIIAQAFLTPAANIMAKYGQEAFGMKVKVVKWNITAWFLVHTLMTVLSVIISIIGVIVIGSELGWRSGTTIAKCHSAFGIICYLTYAVSIGLGAYLYAKYRDMKYFEGKTNVVRWVHWFIGNCNVFIGIFLLIFAPEMQRAFVPCIFHFLGSLLLVVHLLTIIVMSFHSYWLANLIGSEQKILNAIVGPTVPFGPDEGDKEHFHKFDTWRGQRLAIIFYFAATAIISCGMIGLLLFPKTICFSDIAISS